MMPLILRQLAGSEKFWYAMLVMVPLTIFTAMGLMTVDAWRNDAIWVLAILTGGKTLTSMADRLGSRPVAAPSDQAAVTAVNVNVPPAPAPVDTSTRRMTEEELEAAIARQTGRLPPAPPPPIQPGE